MNKISECKQVDIVKTTTVSLVACVPAFTAL